MIVYAASDLHGNLPAVPDDAELLLLVGDICPDFRPTRANHWASVDTSGLRQAAWLREEFAPWRYDSGIPAALVWGNHDYIGMLNHLVDQIDMGNTYILEDSEVTLGGLRIWGTPWVPRLERWAFYGDQRKLELRAEAIPEGLDFLITHGPPYGAGDFVPYSQRYRDKYNTPTTGERAGDSTLNSALKRAKPRVTLCGHIHEDRGAHWCEGQRVYNVAAVDALYDLHANPWRRFDTSRW